jgi:hypothetical protein
MKRLEAEACDTHEGGRENTCSPRIPLVATRYHRMRTAFAGEDSIDEHGVQMM